MIFSSKAKATEAYAKYLKLKDETPTLNGPSTNAFTPVVLDDFKEEQ